MISLRITFLALLALSSSFSLATAWSHELLENWGKHGHLNIYGKPINVSTECGGNPCPIYPLVKPNMTNVDEKYCGSHIAGGVVCNHVPKNATLVSQREFDRLFPSVNESVPTFPHDPHTLEKRSRWWADKVEGLQLKVWPRNTRIVYGISADKNIAINIPHMAEVIKAAIKFWTDACGEKSIFANWEYNPVAFQANFWFHLSTKPVVGDIPGAIAIAFFPFYYPNVRTTVLIDNTKIERKKHEDVILTLAHEIGHVLGLAHEITTDNKNVWSATESDPGSIMSANLHSLTKITPNDCLALKYYSGGFPTQVMCKTRPGQAQTCKTMITTEVKLAMVGPDTRQATLYTKDGRDQTLEDIDGPCLGGDINKYITNAPHETQNRGGYGWFYQGVALSECEAVRVPSDPDYFYAMQSDGNFVSYEVKTKKAIWSTSSQGKGTPGSYNILFQEDGNLVIYDKNGNPTWSSETHYGAPGSWRLRSLDWQFMRGHMYITSNNVNGPPNETDGHLWSAPSTSAVFNKVQIQQTNTNVLGNPGFCLDANMNSGGSYVVLNQCNHGENQIWNIYTDGTIVNDKSGLCLTNTADGGGIGAAVAVFKCHRSPSQIWEILSEGPIRNKGGGTCIDNAGQKLMNGNKIQVWDCGAKAWSENWNVGFFGPTPK
ncbi:hypothetical protein EMPS_05601 [Entomortierella parvispora]|uniref:Bulb-type lectin domain-containing protein n=1 Tax=Entomortierella parvispora TaxID=205924 RepID=A0A9P3HB47_9FUNG|nr:hypothetical protein EMPS_05601 [Entomortierella parvispora]